MINNSGKNFLCGSYIYGIQKILNDMFLDLKVLKSTCSISEDFINQFLIFQRVAEKISKTTAICTNFRPVFSSASEISEKRCEIIRDVQKIEKFCGSFKNCPAGITNYKSRFGRICEDYGAIFKKNMGIYRNVNIFFLKFMTEYNNFCVSLNQNVLRYRLCPQLRLIVEYSVLIARKENIKMKGILDSIK